MPLTEVLASDGVGVDVGDEVLPGGETANACGRVSELSGEARRPAWMSQRRAAKVLGSSLHASSQLCAERDAP